MQQISAAGSTGELAVFDAFGGDELVGALHYPHRTARPNGSVRAFTPGGLYIAVTFREEREAEIRDYRVP